MFCFFLKSTYVFLGCFVLSKGVSLTYIVRGRRCRPFDILRTSFSRHIMRVSALRYSSLVVQSTHHVVIGCSALSVMRSADIVDSLVSFVLHLSVSLLRLARSLYTSPNTCTAMIGVIATRAIMPKLSETRLFPSIALAAPWTKERMNVAVIGPDATPPESKAMPTNILGTKKVSVSAMR